MSCRQKSALAYLSLKSISKLQQRCSSRLSFYLNALFFVLCLCLLRLENKPFVRWRKSPERYFPKVDFYHLKPADPLRLIIQALFLCCLRFDKNKRQSLNDRLLTLGLRLGHTFHAQLHAIFLALKGLCLDLADFIASLSDAGAASGSGSAGKGPSKLRLLSGFGIALVLLLILWCITQPLTLFYQLIFVGLMLELALLLSRMHNNFTLLCLMVISLIISSRYMFWRAGYTLNFITMGGFVCSITLFLAECYTFLVMVLGYFQLALPLDRKPVPIELAPEDYPSVDVMIPTYDEPLDVVKPTVYGALNLDWPKDKLHVYILDDGTRSEFRDFAAQAGCGYIVRQEHKHAKAGNINHALTKTTGEYVAIFDCDHVPVHAFLQLTVGVMIKDPRTALVQTPHHFYSQNPFERNLDIPRIPQEDSLFHDLIQKGNDLWNATMFCGSCAVIRRAALDEIGGIAVNTVTEDAHTSLKLARRGWNAAAIAMPLAAGLSTETLSAHISQRIRWARGMIQIFRIENPLFGRGLTLGQRLCYLNAMMHFLHGIPRIIFILAPLPYLLFGTYVIYAQAAAILSYVIPHMLHSTLTNMERQKGYRMPFWSGIYETVLSWYITLPTLIALINPRFGKFNVTAKGGRIEADFFDWAVSKPYMLLIFLNLLGFSYGLYQLCFDPAAEIFSLLLNLGWLSYNLVILGGSIAALHETRQVRRFPRVRLNLPLLLETTPHRFLSVRLADFSQGGIGLVFDEGLYPKLAAAFKPGARVRFYLPYNQEYYGFNAELITLERSHAGLKLQLTSIEEEKRFNYCTISRSDLWSHVTEVENGLLPNFYTVLKSAVSGYKEAIKASPGSIRLFFAFYACVFELLFSFVPQRPLPLKINEVAAHV